MNDWKWVGLVLLGFVLMITALERRDSANRNSGPERDSSSPKHPQNRSVRHILSLIDAHIKETKSDQAGRKRHDQLIGTVSVLTLAIGIAYTTLTYLQLNATRESFTAVQRAFVTMDDPQITKIAGPDDTWQHPFSATLWEIRPVIHNSGNTPTKDLEWISITIAGPSPIGIEPGQALVMQSQNGHLPWEGFWNVPTDPAQSSMDGYRALLGPQSKMPIGGVNASGSAVSAAEKDGRSWFVYGLVRYRDIFPGSQPHLTKFCYQIARRQTGPDAEKDVALRILTCKYWNCADYECKKDRQIYERDIARTFAAKGYTVPTELLNPPKPTHHTEMKVGTTPMPLPPSDNEGHDAPPAQP